MDFSEYDPSWSDVIRPAILARDKFKCQECGARHRHYYLFQKGKLPIKIEAPEYLEYKTIGLDARILYLQVAHLDCDKTNNDYTNLKSLCPTCHLRYDRAWKKVLRLSKKKVNLSFGKKS